MLCLFTVFFKDGGIALKLHHRTAASYNPFFMLVLRNEHKGLLRGFFSSTITRPLTVAVTVKAAEI
jgi:hypothetical protein